MRLGLAVAAFALVSTAAAGAEQEAKRVKAEPFKMAKMTAGRAVHMAVGYPVVYTGNAGGGPNEYNASNNPDAANTHLLHIGLPKGARVIGAWYVPNHNIPALSAFARIQLGATSGEDDVELYLAGFGNSNQRLRIQVFVLYEQ